MANGTLNPLTLLVHASLIWDTTSLARVEINSVGLSQSNKLTRINEPLVKNIHPGVHTLLCIGLQMYAILPIKQRLGAYKRK